MAEHPRFIFIGGGNMARALVLGAVEREPARRDGFAVIEPDSDQHGVFRAASVPVFASLHDAAADPRADLRRGSTATVVLAIKPQSLGEVAKQWGEARLGFDGVVITMLAGTSSEAVRAALGGAVRVIRVMPNTPSRIGEGATAVALGACARAGDERAAFELFGPVSPVIEVVAESLMNAVTALSGSGPAYLFYLAEGMIRAGIEAGIPPDVCERLTRQTLAGAARMLSQSPETPATLRAAVTSKGGTTEAAIAALNAGAWLDLVQEAIVAARDRGEQLGARHPS